MDLKIQLEILQELEQIDQYKNITLMPSSNNLDGSDKHEWICLNDERLEKIAQENNITQKEYKGFLLFNYEEVKKLFAGCKEIIIVYVEGRNIFTTLDEISEMLQSEANRA